MQNLNDITNNNMKKTIIMLVLALVAQQSFAQDIRTLTLSQTIELAQKQSPAAVMAQHNLRSAYWSYRYYKATFRPAVTLTSSPTFNRGIDAVIQPDGTTNFVHVSQMSTDASLQISQNLPFTGGNLFVQSSILRDEQIEGNGNKAYRSQPISIGYRHNAIGYNEMKWNRRIEPIRWQEAQKRYSESMELVASQACSYFFALASAQTSADMSRSNLASADTLCSFAEGRYNLGTISENEMLQLKLNRLNEETNLLDANVALDAAAEALRNYLDLPTTTQLRVITDNNIQDIEVPLAEALELAMRNSPDPDYYRRSCLESRNNLANVKANSGLRASLYLQFGLSQTGPDVKEAYHNPTDMQYASISVSIPILDWGRGKGSRRIAKSQVALADLNAEQGMKSFEQNVIKMVQQFNLQSRRVQVASQKDATAERRYDVARQLYMMGKNTILDLNSAIAEKDAARHNHIASLATYWSLYFGLRSMTGYDFALNLHISWPLPEQL